MKPTTNIPVSNGWAIRRPAMPGVLKILNLMVIKLMIADFLPAIVPAMKSVVGSRSTFASVSKPCNDINMGRTAPGGILIDAFEQEPEADCCGDKVSEGFSWLSSRTITY